MRNSLSLQTINNAKNHILSYAVFSLSAMAAFLWSGDAHAQANTMGLAICNVVNQIYSPNSAAGRIANLMSGIAYISGAIAIGSGLYKMKEYAENPGRPPLHQPVSRLIGGAALLALPAILGWMIETLALTPGGGGLTTCTPGGMTATAAASPDTMISNLMKDIKNPMTFLMSVMGYTLGTLLMVRGLLKLSKYGTDPNAYSIPKILANTVVGGIIFTIGSSAALIMNTMFGTGTADSTAVDSWKIITSANNPTTTLAVKSALAFVQIVGMIAFLRGWWIIKSSVEGGGQATMAQGITHIMGGIMCLNIFYVAQMFNNTLGLNLL